MTVGVGRIYRDEKNGGHLHIPRRLMERLNFADSEIVLVKVEKDKLVVEKLEDRAK